MSEETAHYLDQIKAGIIKAQARISSFKATIIAMLRLQATEYECFSYVQILYVGEELVAVRVNYIGRPPEDKKITWDEIGEFLS